MYIFQMSIYPRLQLESPMSYLSWWTSGYGALVQCDQIGLFLKGLEDKFSCESCPNIWAYFQNHCFLVILLFIFGAQFWKTLATFSTIWSHWTLLYCAITTIRITDLLGCLANVVTTTLSSYFCRVVPKWISKWGNFLEIGFLIKQLKPDDMTNTSVAH